MYSETQRQILKWVAKESISYGLDKGRCLPVNIDDFEPALRETRATFVTLKIDDQLRGCIGQLYAQRPLAEDVAENAFLAAFRDRRFSPMTEAEYPLLAYHISILEEPVSLPVSSEEDLIEKLVPGKDGIILGDDLHRGTFLPAVWDALPDPGDFVKHLKLKAGLPATGWSDQYRVQRYRVEEF